MRKLIGFTPVAVSLLALGMTPQTAPASLVSSGDFTEPAAANANFPLRKAGAYLAADTDQNIFSLGAPVPSSLSFASIPPTTKRASSVAGFTSTSTSSGLIVTAVAEPLTYVLPLFGLVLSSVLMWKSLGRTNEDPRADRQ
ncbi:MAG TPA: hypothetical protein VF988_17115 [Verrucomicrobiae bacterium]